MLAKRTSKNQITLPKAIISKFPGIDYFEITSQDGHIILDPVRTNQADKVRAKLESLGIQASDLEDAIKHARGIS
ncbi:MAG: AbrB/MazE/SpoVT family DNA-binding domain-containing protein [Pseudomonadales bacterium]|nr:AbrB/MazE/SpoVT family DNA-binding domain-containing protein [Pseudomonadales bacterium]MDP7143919.1 AbrB/MazE/SpoVT family DNA-binding domain-containing protein [Pseudomonadales bacterium]MDP7357348.1 AbrB/MazE/SpoVT family DNA-binding domain-containing protein [Pseudomonadales bacterium]MDP7595903.1 AbrB/MazE/SpoVT family DNA-binding domain-containing protein [Pseudomonadales bacterium]HJN49310.1 AbrB/MazE/SpoVT family DNA-binding domain-containing protein [Pseudomonadales bacterium]